MMITREDGTRFFVHQSDVKYVDEQKTFMDEGKKLSDILVVFSDGVTSISFTCLTADVGKLKDLIE